MFIRPSPPPDRGPPAFGGVFPLGASLGKLGVRGFRPSAIGWMFLMLFTYYVAAGLFSLVLEPKSVTVLSVE